MENCIFCQIITYKIPADFLYEDDQMVVVQDVHPLAPIHLLMIPRKHIASMNQIVPEDELLLSKLFIKGREMAFLKGIGESGYRLVINTGTGGGQTIFHLHVHLLGGASIDNAILTRGLK
jgi:histidine triad (HIT) family protein